MASVAQIQANRLNAQKSTGPRTAEGKERASRNALKHGLLAREVVIAGEDPEEFELYREGMLAELAPAGVVETMLAERVVGLAWRLRRAERLQNMAFAALDEGELEPLLEARQEEWRQLKGSDWDRGVAGVLDEDAALGQVVVDDFAGARVLDRLLMYERRIESSLYRTMAQLRREREARQARAAAATPEGVSRAEGRLPAGQESVTPAKLGSFGANVAAETPDGPGSSPGQAPPAKAGVTTNTPAGQESSTPAQLASFGADAAQGRVSSLKCEVSSLEEVASLEGASSRKWEVSSAENQVSSDGSDFTLPTSPFKRAPTTPAGPGSSPGQAPPAKAGVTTNAVEEPSCETNPIGGSVKFETRVVGTAHPTKPVSPW
jgi:hypothetical protein